MPAPITPEAAEPAAPAGEAVKVVRGATIATVNGVAISGADAVAFRAKTGEALTLTPEMRDFLVKRAIERELTMQAAKAHTPGTTRPSASSAAWASAVTVTSAPTRARARSAERRLPDP